MADTNPILGAAAPALELLRSRQPEAATSAPEMDPSGDTARQRGYQPSLFLDAANRPRVIPIPTLTPVRTQSGARRRGPRTPGSRNIASRRGGDSQQSLNFHNIPANTLDTQPEAVIFCDAPVALPAHRIMAAAVDASMIAISIGLFLGVFYFSGGHIAITRQTIALFAGIVMLIGLLYRILWSLGNSETPGMRFAGLRLVNFDGHLPGREQRGVRQAAYLLSLLSAGVGLLWAFVDEENLTWHDHISKTFPTPG
jgi:uncharacterized RDD family membrane protein YckC